MSSSFRPVAMESVLLCMTTTLQCQVCRTGHEYAGPKLKSNPLIHCEHCNKVTRANVFNLLHRGDATFKPLNPELKHIIQEQNDDLPRKPQVEKPPRPGRQHHPIPELTEKKERRFWSRVRIGDGKACWPWTGTKDQCGYGVFYLRGIRYVAGRVACRLAARRDPESLPVNYTCGNRACCNPTHLIIRWPEHTSSIDS